MSEDDPPEHESPAAQPTRQEDANGLGGPAAAGGTASNQGPLPPPFAQTATEPAATDANPAMMGRGGAPSTAGRGRTATKAASPSEPRDLLGDPPAEVLTIRMARNPQASDFNNFADQMLEMIAEDPDNALRRTRIKMANDTGLLALKTGAVERYDEVMAALARKA